ncbi:MAG: PEP-CTERM sorting domain-containing protein [Caulobacteraceae bacterium]|nr:PEP-CTERM sorting domain-containing protein [Caulobacteraceae bacterium]
MRPKLLVGVVAGMLAFAVAGVSAAGATTYTEIDLSSQVNHSWATANGGFDVTDFPVGAYTSPSGTPFLISSCSDAVCGGGSSGYAGYVSAQGDGGYGRAAVSFTFDTDIVDATSAGTLLNSIWGQDGQTGNSYLSITFNATGGVSETFNLFGDSDLRDYADNVYTDFLNNGVGGSPWATGAVAVNGVDGYGSTDNGQPTDRMDEQSYLLSPDFIGQTLTSVVMTDIGGDNFQAGALSALTIESGVPTVSGAPEPSVWALIIAGVGGVGLMLRRAKRTGAFAAA